MMCHPAAPGISRFFLSLLELHGPLVTQCVPLSQTQQSSLTVGGAVWDIWPFCASVTHRDHWDRGDIFMTASDSQYPILWHLG